MDNRDADDEFNRITNGQQMSRMARLLAGELTVEELDDEELYRGQCRDVNGNFTGGKRDMVPRAMIVEWQRRLRTGGLNKLDGNLTKLIDVVVSIATNPEENSTDRLNAAKYGIDRILGKATERVELTVETKPWEAMLAPGGIFRRIDPETEPAAVEVKEIEP